MKKTSIKLLCISFSLVGALTLLACNGNDNIVTIYTSMEDYCIEYLQECVDEEFPEYKVIIEYMGTSNIAAKVLEEKDSSECDIVFGLEYALLEKLAKEEAICDMSDLYDKNDYLDDTVASNYSSYFSPCVRQGGAVVVNKTVLSNKGLQKPTSYNDLLESSYKGLISMPSPKSSGTGYMFYLSLVNSMGEQAALNYFDSLSSNVLSFTASGSGPVNSLVQREVAVGLGMISQAVEKINSGNTELEILFFDEGAPFNLYGNTIVIGKNRRQCVIDVMKYINNTFTDLNCEKFYPEPVLKDTNYSVSNYPININYSNMSGNTIEKKEDLLSKWSH
ncbi:extracellular solute-binding protein [Acholeplasma sp. OttesenSCG-928-E16]|nr:extracellular solute-binding protein [Acholeplasma sp. OttesenSCG-928-E16]